MVASIAVGLNPVHDPIYKIPLETCSRKPVAVQATKMLFLVAFVQTDNKATHIILIMLSPGV